MKKLIIFILLVIILLYGGYKYSEYIFPHEFSDYVSLYSDRYNLDKDLVYSVIKAESNFNKDATSHKNAIGLMQITKETGIWVAEKIGIDNYSDKMLKLPEINIQIGTWYLNYLIDELENENYAVMAYNAGINNVKNWIKEGYLKNEDNFRDVPYKETRRYIKKVNFYKKVYRFLYRD